MNGTPSPEPTAASTVDRVLVNLVWVAGFPDLVATPEAGSMSTSRAYRMAHETLGSGRDLPWLTDPGPGAGPAGTGSSGSSKHWSHFWSSYLGSTGPVRRGALSSEKAWEYAIPHELLPRRSLVVPGGGTAAARRLAYPTAAVVIVEIELTGSISFADLPAGLAALRVSSEWGVADAAPGGAAGVQTNRTLNGVAAGLLVEIYDVLVGPANAPGQLAANAEQSRFSVAAPAHGLLSPADRALPAAPNTDPASLASPAAATVASLAALTTTATFDPAKMLSASTAGPTRIYLTSLGHSLWNPTLLDGSTLLDDKDRIGCLARNHVELVGHIEALSTPVRWGAARAQNGLGVDDKQANLIWPALRRLRALQKGDKTKTYQSEVAAKRLVGLEQDMDAVEGIL